MMTNQLIELTKITSLPGIEKGDVLADNLLKHVLSEGQTDTFSNELENESLQT